MRVITQPGVYVMEENQYRPGGYGLSIMANNVYIDLGGHHFGGYGTTAINAIGRSGITVANGSIGGDWNYAIRIEGLRTSNNVVKDIVAFGSRAVGIAVEGSGALIQNNSVYTIGHASYERAFAFNLTGPGHVLRDNFVWNMRGTLESGAVALNGPGVHIYNNSFNGDNAGGVWYAIWQSGNGDGDTVHNNRFYRGEVALVDWDGKGTAYNNSFEYMTSAPYRTQNYNNLGGDVILTRGSVGLVRTSGVR
jgi:hypothetical protein